MNTKATTIAFAVASVLSLGKAHAQTTWDIAAITARLQIINGQIVYTSPLPAAPAPTPPPPPAPIPPTGPIQGTNPQEIDERFAQVIERNLDDPARIEQVLSQLSDTEMSALATEYTRTTYGNTMVLDEIIASTATAATAQRFQAMEAQAISRATAQGLPAPLTPTPNINMPLTDIYLEFRTAPIGSLSTTGALAETALFAGARLVPAFYASQILGNGVDALVSLFDPNFNNRVGNIGEQIFNFVTVPSGPLYNKFYTDVNQAFYSPLPWSGTLDFGLLGPDFSVIAMDPALDWVVSDTGMVGTPWNWWLL